MNFGFFFDRIFAGNEAGFERYRVLFEQLGDLGFESGNGVTSITVGILTVLRRTCLTVSSRWGRRACG